MSKTDNYIDLTQDNYVLTRLEDDKQMTASVVKFIEWNENGTGNKAHDEPAIGRSIVLDPAYGSYSWLTTTITEIINENTFKTLNSTYKLHKL